MFYKTIIKHCIHKITINIIIQKHRFCNLVLRLYYGNDKFDSSASGGHKI